MTPSGTPLREVLKRPDARAPAPAASGTPSRFGLLALVASNLIPLVGVLAFGWSLRPILMLYWMEGGVIGALNVPRILLALGPPKPGGRPDGIGLRVFLAAFFCVHYGMFWFGHLAFAQDIVAKEPPLAEVGLNGFWISVLAFTLSHGVSFVVNYLGRGEYRRASPVGRMFAPYGRVVVLHLTVLLGGIAAVALGSPVWAVVVLVVLKTLGDVAAHWLGHGGSLGMGRSKGFRALGGGWA